MSWSTNSANGAFSSLLKLPVDGYRGGSSYCKMYCVASDGGYWSSSIDGTRSRYLIFYSGFGGIQSDDRSIGYCIRCIKD